MLQKITFEQFWVLSFDFPFVSQKGNYFPLLCVGCLSYTSLGSMEDTHPNPELRAVDATGRAIYQPAYTLKDTSSERSGRTQPANNNNHVP